jgi:hypothetical protein
MHRASIAAGRIIIGCDAPAVHKRRARVANRRSRQGHVAGGGHTRIRSANLHSQRKLERQKGKQRTG